MINYKKYINEEINRILKIDKLVPVTKPPKENMGDYCVFCYELKNDKMNPIEVANFIKDNFNDKDHYFIKIEVISLYVNFYLDYNVLSNFLIKEIDNKNSKYGSRNQGNNEELLIEHTSINPNASPHIGRSRNAITGDFISRLYKYVGYDVSRYYFINDMGKQIAMLVVGVEKYGSKHISFDDMLDIYIKINEDCKNDETILDRVYYYLQEVENGNKEVREKFKDITDICVKGQMKILKELNIEFDYFVHESDYVFNNKTDKILNKIKEKNKLKEDEFGRLYVDLSDYNIKTKSPVIVLTRKDKTSLYPIRDIAFTIDKLNVNNKHNYIVLGEDQITYMSQISAVLDILGYKSPKLISYSFVLLEGNKMASREGTVVLLEDFIKKVKEELHISFKNRNLNVSLEKINILSNACIKFSMLNVSKNKILNFNWDNAISFNGESGVYILYSIVRINSILKISEEKNIDKYIFNHPVEYQILDQLYEFENIIEDLLKTLEPSHLTKYIFNLSQKFSKFYEEVNILKEPDEILRISRIKLLQCIKTVLTNGLNILGISTLEEM